MTSMNDLSHWKVAAETIARDWFDHSKKDENGQKAAMLIRCLVKAGAFDPQPKAAHSHGQSLDGEKK